MAPQTRQRAGTEYDACWPVWEAIQSDDDDDDVMMMMMMVVV